MDKKDYRTLYILMGILIIILIIYAMVLHDFYIDYKCSTTYDIKWYSDNNCLKYFNNGK